MRVVVVGGTGYVGGRVAAHLRDRGADVVVAGRNVDGGMIVPAERLDVVRDADDRLDAVLRCAGAIVNCVAVGEAQARDDPAQAEAVAVLTSTRLAQAAARLGVGRLLQFSTVRVYGIPAGDLDETSPLAPVNPTAIAHARGEQALAEASGHDTGLATTVLRLSNVVGPPVRPTVRRWDVLTNDLARTWAASGRMVLRSSGTQRRDFVALENVARVVSHLLVVDRPPAVLNVSSGRTIPVLDVASRMAELAGKVSGLRPEPVLRPAPTAGETESPRFRFRNDRVRATGFDFLDLLDAELEATLRFAARHFSGQPA